MTTNEPQDFQLPEYSGNPFIANLPPILSMAAAVKALNAPPAFHERERSFPDELRVHCIQRLNNYFLPLEQHLKLEMALSVLIRQGYVSRNPLDETYFQRLQDGHDRIVHKDLLLGQQRSPSTASSMALVGCSGMGKSRTVERLLNLYPKIIYHEAPYSFYQIVWLKLDCPLQGSPKQLCISFFQAIDDLLGTNYIRDYAGPRRGLDEMIRNMFHVANLHAVGVLVIDEIQHLNQTRGAGPDVLLNFLVTLVNTIGIPVLTVGTHGAMSVLQGNFRQARRASGLGSPVWNNLKPDRTWDHFVDAMWRYQWTQEFTPLTDELLYSLLARFHRHVGETSPKRTLDVLFGNRSVRAGVLLQGHLQALSERLPPQRKLTPGRLLADFTLYPYLTAFQPEDVRQAGRDALFLGHAEWVTVRLGLAASRVQGATALRYCPACRSEMLTRYGELYWRRDHQLPGVAVCPEHGMSLRDSTVCPGTIGQHSFVAADENNCPKVSSDAQDDASIPWMVAKRCARLLRSPPAPMSLHEWGDLYHHELRQRGFGKGEDRIDQRRWSREFAAWSGDPEMPGTESWLAAMVRKHRKAFHPLQHVLLSLFLDAHAPVAEGPPFGLGPWPCRNPLAEHYG